MKHPMIDIEKGFANRLYRLVMAFVPMRDELLLGDTRLDPVSMGWLYGHGNTYLQTGRVLSDGEYLKLRDNIYRRNLGVYE